MASGWGLLADLTLLAHGAFVLFVLLGGLIALRRPRAAWLHLPCAAWGAVVEFTGWGCPLTPLENALRQLAGEAGYSGGFLAHYLLSTLYPAGLTPGVRMALGGVVVAVNTAVYTAVWRRRRA